MAQRSGFSLMFILVLGTFLVACSGGGSPLSPNLNNGTDITPHQSATIGAKSHVCWGYWDITIDPVTGSAEIIPVREVAFNANVTMFLQPPIAPVNLLKLLINPDTDFSTGYVDCNITLEHPFMAFANFRGFDVRGIFMSDGSMAVESVPGLMRSASDEAQLLNADGLTRWWNASEFGPEGKIFGYQMGKLGYNYYPTATLNPYKYFADDLNETDGVETLAPSTRGTFTTNPGLNTRNYLIQFPMAGPTVDYHFQYAIDASWDSPDPSFAPDFPIEAFNESAQMREPYHLTMWDTGSSAYYESSTVNGGELNLAIEVFDWQTSDSGVSTELSALYLESPVFATPVDVLPIAIEMSGSQPTSRIYSVVLDDLTLTGSGEKEVLIAAQSSIGTYEPNIDGGTVGFVYPDEPLVAFAIGSVNILGESQNNPPVAIADDTSPTQGGAPLTVHLDPTGSYDPDPGDSIVLYEWDIDSDDTYEYNNTDGAVVDHVFTESGTFYVQLRVTDSFGAWDLLDVPLEIQIFEDEWPAGFYNAQNTAYNPNSHVAPPLSLVYNVDHIGNNHSMLTIGRDKIYMVEGGGYLRVFDEATGTQQWEKDIHVTGISSFWTGASANLWGDSVFTGGTGIWSFNADVGTDEWHVYPATTFDHQGMVIVDDKIWFRGSGGTFVSVNTSDGSENWSISQTSHPLFPPAYGEVGGQGYVAAPHSAYLRCVNADTGVQVWQQNAGGNVYHNPVVIGEYVYYGGSSGTLYKTHLETGTNAVTYNLSGYQPLGMWISESDLFMVVRLGSANFKLMSFDFDLGNNWEVPIVHSCEQGTYSDGYIWLAVRHDGSYMQMTAYDASDGSQAYVHPETFSYAWGGITNVNNKLYIADNQGHLLCFESE